MGSNISGNAYALTILSPIKDGLPKTKLHTRILSETDCKAGILSKTAR